MRFFEIKETRSPIVRAIRDFLPIAIEYLKLESLPKIEFAKDVKSKHDQPTFAVYHHDTDTKIIKLDIEERHPIDIIRTLAHELVHYKQDLEDRLSKNSWRTGSPTENEAHEKAGIMMRMFDKKFPKYLHLKAVRLEEGKKRKKRRWAAYGPGPFGGYGYATGYSGDGGGGDGGVGEDQHPNENPRGPEFKPTMPKGTVRVDVSDVYDWYKLGKNFANLKNLDKSQFGKGPPSTIVAFGSEEEEHEYLKDLEKLGLNTTDIDPKDPKQPKGMKRQKTDPTYNVENFAEGKVKGKSRPGRVKKAGASCDGSVTSLRQRAKNASGERAKMYHWCANMKSGRNK